MSNTIGTQVSPSAPETVTEAALERVAEARVRLPRRLPRRILKAYAVWLMALAAATAVLFIAASGPVVLNGLLETARSLVTWQTLAILLAALACEYVDSTLGMGYGTTLTPVLLLVGFEPLVIVPAVLLSELVTGLTSGVMHHGAGNVNFRRGSRHRHVALVLAGCSVLGTLAAVMISIQIPKWALTGYIGVLVLAIGVTILSTMHKTFAFSWKRIAGLGLLAAFNKGMSGGGYGPVVSGGQVLSGVDARQAVGITSMAEGLTCVVGAALYLVTTGIDGRLALPLVVGAMLSVPLSVHSVRAVRDRHLRLAIGVLTLVLGTVTLVRLVW
jgi:hypothetical protein